MIFALELGRKLLFMRLVAVDVAVVNFGRKKAVAVVLVFVVEVAARR